MLSEEEIKNQLREKYKARGAQQMTLAEYQDLANKSARRRKFNTPAPLKFFIMTPFLIIFCAGIFYIPYILYLVLTSPSADAPEKTPAPAYQRNK